MLLLNKNINLALLLLLFISTKVLSQQYNYRNYTTQDGLASAEVYHAIQDSKGYIWFATDDGISRFDGVNFRNFGIKDGLVNNVIFDLYEDIKGRIWMISFSGQLCYYENGQIFRYKYNNNINKFIKGRHIPAKSSFYIDSVENIYLSIEYLGVIKIANDGNVSNLTTTSSKSVIEVIQLNEGKKLIGHNFNQTKDIELVINGNRFNFEYSVFRSSTMFLLQNNRNEDLVSVKFGIYKYKDESLSKIKSNEDIILWFSKDKKNRYWLSTFEQGIKCFEDDDFSKQAIYHFLKNKNVSSVLIDHENGYWFTTLNNGVYYLPYAEIRSLNIENEKSKNVISVTAKNNKVFIGLQDKTIRIYDKDLKKEVFKKKFSLGKTPKKLVYNKTMSKLIIGTYSFCYIFDDKSNKVVKQNKLYTSHRDKIDHGVAVNDFCFDENNHQWLGTNIGLVKYEHNINTYRSDIENEWKETVLAIEKSGSNNLWLATFNGLWKYHDNNFTYLGNKNELLANRINSLIQFKDSLYLATNGYGLVIYDIENKTVKQFSVEDGLASNSIAQLKKHNHQLYIATNKGVNIVDLRQNEWSEVLKLDKNSGLVSNDINEIHIEDDILYIASKNGLNSVDLNSIVFNKNIPKVYIEKIKINGKDTCQFNKLNLNYDQNNISIPLVAVSYKNEGNTVFKYKLEPIDNKWKETSSNEIHFSSLEPGSYVFSVKCKNENNVWSKIESDISLTINTPYWKKWWFMSMPYVIIGLIIALFLQKKLYKLRKENMLRKELKTYFYKTLATQLNPHFIFNSLNSLNKFILKEDKLNASLYLAKISNYLRAVFDTIQGEFISLQGELEILDIYLKLEKNRLKDKLNFEIKVDSTIEASKISLPALIFVPLVEKAVWTRLNNVKKSGFVKVSVNKLADRIEILIEDNGSLNDHDDELYIGKNIQKRVELLNKLYGKEVSFEFTKNAKVSFNETGNIVKLSLKPSNGEYLKKKL